MGFELNIVPKLCFDKKCFSSSSTLLGEYIALEMANNFFSTLLPVENL